MHDRDNRWLLFIHNIPPKPPYLRAKASRRLAALSLRLSAVVASRDAMSTACARDLGARRVIEASDVALRLPHDPPAPRSGPVRVGLNVSGLLMAGGTQPPSEKEAA